MIAQNLKTFGYSEISSLSLLKFSLIYFLLEKQLEYHNSNYFHIIEVNYY
jgi:hypothetical protein